MTLSLHLILLVLIVVFNHSRGICLFKTLNRLLRKLFPILAFEAESVSKEVCLLFVQMFSFEQSKSKGDCLILDVCAVVGHVVNKNLFRCGSGI